MSQMVTLREAAELLGISVRTARRWIRAGRLPAQLQSSRYGQAYLVPMSAIRSLRTDLMAGRLQATTEQHDHQATGASQEPAVVQHQLAQLQQELLQMAHALAAARAEIQQLRVELIATRRMLDDDRTNEMSGERKEPEPS